MNLTQTDGPWSWVHLHGNMKEEVSEERKKWSYKRGGLSSEVPLY